MKSMAKHLIATAAFATLGFSTAAHAVVVDLFDQPIGTFQRVTTETLNATDFNQTGPFPTTSVVGGYRDLSIRKTGDTSGNVNLGAATMTVDSGVLAYSNDAGVTSRGYITWDGANLAGAQGTLVSPTGLGGVDLTNGGFANEFLVQVFSADLGFNYSITVWDMDGDRSTLSAGVQFQVNAPVATNYFFDWFNLGNGTYCNGVAVPPNCVNPLTQLQFGIDRSGGQIDFTRVGAIQLMLEGARADVDLSIGAINTNRVPEPASLALVGLALAGAGVASRRRSRAA